MYKKRGRSLSQRGRKFASINCTAALTIAEAARVLAFRRINDEGGIKEHEKLQQLGSLMSKSHASLHKLYECSHPNVDALVEKALHYGAFGARLTGAG